MEYRRTEHLLPCPFEKSHQIQPHRMALHIAKCRKNHRDVEVKTCFFNATHIVPVQEFQNHIVNCIDRRPVERFLYVQQKPTINSTELQDTVCINSTVQNLPDNIMSEDWDSELVEKTYNPSANAVYKEFSRPPPPGLGSAERKAWRVREDERVRRLREGLPIHDLINDVDDDKDGVSSTEEQVTRLKKDRKIHSASEPMRVDHPLRRPRIAANFFTQAEAQHQGDKIEEVTGEEEDPERVFLKERRKLNKKIKAVEKIIERKNNGDIITEEEEEKIAKKDQFISELNDLIANFNL